MQENEVDETLQNVLEMRRQRAEEKQAREARIAALERDISNAATTQTSLFNDDDCSSLPLFQK